MRDMESYLYLLTNKQVGQHKIGIGTVGKDKNRLQQLTQSGWEVQGLWHADDKHKTFNWEKEVFRHLKARFDLASPDVPGFVGRSDGHWFEGVSAQAISVTELAQLITSVVPAKVK